MNSRNASLSLAARFIFLCVFAFSILILPGIQAFGSAADDSIPNQAPDTFQQASAQGLPASPNWMTESNQSNAVLGTFVSTAGDVNGDGYADVIAVAPYFSSGNVEEGKAFVYYGSALGLPASPSWTIEPDMAEGYMGRAVTGGDINGDGYDDIIASTHFYDNGEVREGLVMVWYGSATGLGANGNPTNADWIAESNQAYAYLGGSIAGADVNGDGYSDVIAAAHTYTNGETDEGKVFIWYGSASGLGPNGNPANADWAAELNQEGAQFGLSVASAGDVNGDSYQDVLVGAHFYDNGQTDEGAAFLFYGSASGPGASPNWTSESNQAEAYYGYALSTAGDVNADGYADIMIGAAYYDNAWQNAGKAYVYYGSATGPGSTANWTLEGTQVDELVSYEFGLGTAGDVNQDGFADILVGSNNYSNAQTWAGRAQVFYGSASGLDATADWTVEGASYQARLGYAVSTAGDVNGDGVSDVIIGASYYSNVDSKEGAVYVYHGSVGGLAASPTVTPTLTKTVVSGVSWTGTTNLGWPMSFSINDPGTQWSSFVLKTKYVNGGCSVELTKTVPGPGSITSNQFSWSGATYSFTGTFTSSTTATGTFNFINEPTGCGSLTQSGTWNATGSIPFVLTATPSTTATVTLTPVGSLTPTRTPTQTATPTITPAGAWSGTTSLGWPMSFVVNETGTQWSSFVLKTKYVNGGCSVELIKTVPGPGVITNNQFSWSGATYSFTGTFTSPTTATGTFNFINEPTGCGNFTQSGTWNATGSIPFVLTATPSKTATVTLTLARSLTPTRTATVTKTSQPLNNWTGTTNRGWPVTFAVNGAGTQWSSFNLTTQYVNGGCTVETTKVIPGPGSITNKQFNWSGSTFSFTGTFTSLTAATGTYNFVNESTGCGKFSQSGTWSATGKLPKTSTPTATLPPKKILTVYSVGSADGWVLESAENSKVGGTMNSTAGTLSLGDNAARKQYRSILSFTTSGLPDNAVITKVVLKLKHSSVSPAGTSPINLLQGIVVDIRKGYFGTSAVLQLTDFEASANKMLGPVKPVLASGWYSISLTSAATFINKASASGGLTQIRLRFSLDDNNDAVANLLNIVSGNNATAANRPTLVIEYYVP